MHLLFAIYKLLLLLRSFAAITLLPHPEQQLILPLSPTPQPPFNETFRDVSPLSCTAEKT